MMLRLRAVALLLLSPGVGGAAVRAAHSCPAATASAPAAHMAAMDHHRHSTPSAPASEHGGECQCIGACSDSHVAALPATTAAVLAATPIAFITIDRTPDSTPRIEHPRYRHPPSTAPPLV